MKSVFKFMEGVIGDLAANGRIRTSETYSSALRSFKNFRCCHDLSFAKFDSQIAESYEAFLRKRGVCPNSSSFYMRIMRAVYNRAVDSGLTVQRYPFRHVYTGIGKTRKRAITVDSMRKIKNLDLTHCPMLDFTRDIFLFSFYTRGMSFVDIAYLKKKNVHANRLVYTRHKTGQKLCIKWEKCMQEIVDKHASGYRSEYLFPIICSQDADEARRQYINAGHTFNRLLKAIGEMAGIVEPLTMYVARHSWASIARNRNIPLSVISEGMGHQSENTTRIYLASLDDMAIDKANSLVIKAL